MSAISPCDEAAAKQRQTVFFDVFTISAEYYNGTEINTNVLFIHTPLFVQLWIGSWRMWEGCDRGRKKGGGGFPFILFRERYRLVLIENVEAHQRKSKSAPEAASSAAAIEPIRSNHRPATNGAYEQRNVSSRSRFIYSPF